MWKNKEQEGVKKGKNDRVVRRQQRDDRLTGCSFSVCKELYEQSNLTPRASEEV